MHFTSKTNGAPLNSAPWTNKFAENKYGNSKSKSDAETNANAKHVLVSRTDYLTVFLLFSVFSFAIISQICTTFLGLGSCICCNIVFCILSCHVNASCFYFPSM